MIFNIFIYLLNVYKKILFELKALRIHISFTKRLLK